MVELFSLSVSLFVLNKVYYQDLQTLVPAKSGPIIDASHFPKFVCKTYRLTLQGNMGKID